MRTQQLCQALADILDSQAYKDPSYNGLQVQGREDTQVLATATDASLQAIEQAIALGADTLLVHHGLFWKGADPRVVGVQQARIKRALEAGINIVAFHLPLDAHASLGNNAYLCSLLGDGARDYVVPGDKTSIAMTLNLKSPLLAMPLREHLSKVLDTRVELFGRRSWEQPLSRFAVCSGSGSFLVDSNLTPDFDALLTGDVNEQTYQLALEQNIAVFAVGHHASEQDGVRLLGQAVAAQYGLEHKHIHIALEKQSIL